MTAAPRRRWFKFGLRTMFALFTIVCGWVGYQINWIRERHAFVEEIESSTFDVNFSPAPIEKWVVVPQPPLSLRIFGEQYAPFASLYYWDETPSQLVSNAKGLFPEANIECAGPRPIFLRYPPTTP
jgi:hypothetical protein